MKNKVLIKILSGVLAVAILVFAARIVIGSGSTDIPVAYVISDGTNCYYIDYDELVDSYMEYRDDENSDAAKLAKFYFDTLGSNVMNRFMAYVSGVTTKFVNFSEIIDKYVETEDVDSTYIWFNGTAATPAFSAITKVLVLDANCQVAGRYYVGTDGYIIRRSTYVMDTSAPASGHADVPAEFAITVTGNDLGCESFTAVLEYEITGGGYTLETNNGSGWETLTGGTIGSSSGTMITPDWNASTSMRFTAHDSGTYHMTFRMETMEGIVVAQKTQDMAVTSGMQVSASVPAFRVGEPAQFTISTTANDDAGKMVQAHFAIPPGVSVEYQDEVTGDWTVLTDVYGPASGFALADATMVLRGTFTEAGTKTITVQYMEVGTGTVLGSKEITAMAELQMSVSADLPEFYTGEPQPFTISTTANDDADKLVRAYFTIPAGVALEYQEEGTGTWVALTDAYGPAAGFPAADATYTFRATFTGIGTKTIAVQFVEVSTGFVLASEDFIATAQARIIPTIAIPGFKDITIPAYTTDVRVDLKNPGSNTCYFIISLELDDGTILFTSEMLAPSEGIGDITLSEALSQGEYEAIVKYDAYDADDFSPLNTAEVNITLISD